jgi:hypothetical protein
VNAASLHRTASPPVVAAHPVTVSGGGGITPASGQGFVPASSADAAPAPTAQGQAPAPAPATGGQAPPTAEQVLQSLTQLLGDDYSNPIIAADGTIYMERKEPDVSGGTLRLSYLVVGKLDPATGKLQPTEQASRILQEKSKAADGGKRVLVKVGDQMVWQTFAKDEKGKTVVTEVTPATDEEVAAYQQQQQAAAAQQASKAGLEDRVDWQRKIGTVAQGLGIFGSTGQLVSGLAGGPNPYTGKPGAGWISGWILAQRLNGKAEGKLLPQWITSGPVATAMEWGLQAYGLLDTGNDIRVLRDFFKGTKLPPVNPGAVEQLVAKGAHPAMAGAMNQLGTELRDGTLQMVEGTANAAVLNTKLGAVQLVPKAELHKAFAATDPIQDAGLKARASLDAGVTKGIGALGKLVQPAMMGATALGLVSSLISLKNTVATQGAKSLLDTQQGRGTLLGAGTSAAFLGMYLLPMVLPGLGVAMPAVAAASSMVNIAQNVLGGVQLLNSYGMFGGEGFLNNDALRAAFLVPPLTPIGALAFWMKSRKKKQDGEAAKLKAAQQVAVERVTQQREMAKLQLQSTGQISGAVQGPDGSVIVPTNVPNDLSQLAAQLGSGAASPASGSSAAAPGPAAPAAQAGDAGNAALEQQRRQLTMVARPMR